MDPEKLPTHRVMLLSTARSYRNEAFAAAAEKLGIEIVPVIDMAQELADYWQYTLGVDFGNVRDAVATLVAYASRNPVDAILAVDDSGTLVAAQASAHLGLPHNAPAAAEAARDKFQMRTQMTNARVPCPPFHHFSFAEPPETVARSISYPCVVKPRSLNGSRGVIRADNPAEFVDAVRRLRRILGAEPGNALEQGYLSEGYIPGVEVAVEGMLDDGELTVLALFDKPDPLEGPFFEETLYVTPSRLSASVQDEIATCVSQACHALGLRMGPVHAELRVNEQGPWMLEAAGRSIGGLCSKTLRFEMEMSLEELILRQACGLEIPSTNQASSASGVMMIPIPTAGILQAVDGVEAAEQVPHIDAVEITAKVHYPLIPLPEGDSYLGFIFASAETPEQVEQALRAAHARLRFDIVPEFSLQQV